MLSISAMMASGVVGSAPLTRSLDTVCPDAAGIDGACRAKIWTFRAERFDAAAVRNAEAPR
jgi:hypothetical protein